MHLLVFLQGASNSNGFEPIVQYFVFILYLYKKGISVMYT